MPTPKILKSVITSMQKARRAGKTVQEIADSHGVAFGTAHVHTKGIQPTRSQKTAERAKTFKKLVTDGVPLAVAADEAKMSYQTAKKSLGLGLRMPEAVKRDNAPVNYNGAGRWLILGDVHLPQHDPQAIDVAIARAKSQGVKGVLFNGDLLDCHELSKHDKDPSLPRYVEELRIGREFFAYMRQQFPKAEFVYKIGNHEERLSKYIHERAPALEGIEGNSIRSCLKVDEYGVTVVQDKRTINLGRLAVLHGHEYKGGGVNAARWLALKAKTDALCSHLHRFDQHHGKTVHGAVVTGWVTGCLCDLSPFWLPHNDWVHGAAIVEVFNDGRFIVDNFRILDGQIR